MNIEKNLNLIKSSLADDICLIAVSKTKPVSAIKEAYAAGQRRFGENRIPEMIDKFGELPKNIEWHMIGHLQRNKVKYMAHFVHTVHGVDSLKTVFEINKQAKKHNRIINCLLQVKIAQEDTKHGLSIQETESILNNTEVQALSNCNIIGFMGMATFTDDKAQITSEFEKLGAFYKKSIKDHPELTVLSMGMSGDYQLAIEQGSTMVRVGSSIFGSR